MRRALVPVLAAILVGGLAIAGGGLGGLQGGASGGTTITDTLTLTATAATNKIVSSTNAATADTSVAAFTIYPAALLGSNDLIVGIKDAPSGTQVFTIDEDGDVSGRSFTATANVITPIISDGSANRVQTATNTTTYISGAGADGSSAVGVRIGNNATLSTAGARITRFCADHAAVCSNNKADVDLNGFYIQPVQTLTIADNGGGTNATSTLTPTSNLVRCTCNDANGCDITMGETGVQDGTHIRVVSVTATACNFADTSGVSELATAFAAGQYDSIELVYSSDRWIEVGRSNN